MPPEFTEYTKVDPLRLDAESLSARLPGLMVEADHVAATVAQGVHGRRRAGVGETFWQFRPYQQGDSANLIDWRQSAKSRNPFIREQEWEAAESVWLWIDISPSMRFRAHNDHPYKHERAIVLGLALAFLLVRAGERVALFGSGERPKTGRLAVESLTKHLGLVGSNEPLPPEFALPRHARLVLISDFLEPLDRLHQRFTAFSAGQAKVCALQIADPAEEQLPFDGRVEFAGADQVELAMIGNVLEVRNRYFDLYAAHKDGLRALIENQGWRHSRHRTDNSPETALLTLYQMLAPKAVN